MVNWLIAGTVALTVGVLAFVLTNKMKNKTIRLVIVIAAAIIGAVISYVLTKDKKISLPIPGTSKGVEVQNATYGPANVTDTVAEMVSNEQDIPASNDIFGDPQYGVAKDLGIRFDNDNADGLVISVSEGDVITFDSLVSAKAP
jgi:hypothetical protein